MCYIMLCLLLCRHVFGFVSAVVILSTDTSQLLAFLCILLFWLCIHVTAICAMHRLYSARTHQRRIRHNVFKALCNEDIELGSESKTSSVGMDAPLVSSGNEELDYTSTEDDVSCSVLGDVTKNAHQRGVESHCFEQLAVNDSSISEVACESELELSPSSNAAEHESDSYAGSQQHLANWAAKHNVSQVALRELLGFVRLKWPEFPKDPRTLLRTPRISSIKIVAGGSYCYLGLESALAKICETFPVESDLEAIDSLRLYVNIDGVPLFKSSSTSLWPILACVKELPMTGPFVVALFCSDRKPDSVSEYLKDFVAEMQHLEKDGIVLLQKRFNVILYAVICDAPARAFLKCTKTHTGYNACERCTVHGRWCGKMTFPDLRASLRSDVDFAQMKHPSHHTGISPFTSLSLGMVSHWPLDYMHLVCLGVVRRLILLWTKGSRCYRLPASHLTMISQKLARMRRHIPCEFSRKPRTLREVKMWKATEFRLFLLYVGPAVLAGNVPRNVFLNFLSLSVAVRICLSPNLCYTLKNYAEKLLRYFVKSFKQVYGKRQLVYNIHCLIHLPQDVTNYGPLDDISAFRFENYLQILKKMVRRPQDPIAQIVRRLSEQQGQQGDIFNPRQISRENGCRKLHLSGPVPISHRSCLQYKQYAVNDLFISTSCSDSCVDIGGKIGFVRNILYNEESCECFIVFEELQQLNALFSHPLPSDQLSIFTSSKLSGFHQVHPVTAVLKKYVCLPHRHGYALFPLIHHDFYELR